MYIVGIDIAKRFHEAAIIDSSGKVVVKRIRFANSHAGFLSLMEAVRKLDAPAEFGMEATCLSVRPRTIQSTRYFRQVFRRTSCKLHDT